MPHVTSEQHPIMRAMADLAPVRTANRLPGLSAAEVARIARPLFVEGGPTSSSKRRTFKQTQEDLDLVAKHAAGLKAALRRLTGSPWNNYHDVQSLCRTLHIVEVIAQAPLDETTVTASNRAQAHQRLALTAALVFAQYTGRNPTIINAEERQAHGPFIAFLDAIFKARGVSASVENSAKWAIARLPRMERQRPKKRS